MGFDATEDAAVDATGGDAFDWPMFGLIDDVRPALAEARARRETVVLATLHRTEGGAPRGVGAQMLFGRDGALAGFLSGGCVEADVAMHAAATLADGDARGLVYGEGGPIDIALPCGSRIDILLERIAPDDTAVARLLELSEARRPALWTSNGVARTCTVVGESAAPANSVVARRYDPPPRVVIVGGDPVALAVARLAGQMGYLTRLIRPKGPEAGPPLPVGAYLRGDVIEAFESLPSDAWTAVCILTHDIAVEHRAVAVALRSEAAYIGVLGSRRRAPDREAWLRGQGFSETDIARLHAPVGLPIGGKAPWEIAVSVVAEVVQTLHLRADGAV